MDPDSCLSIIEEWCSGFTFASPSVGALAAAVLAVLLLCVSGLVSASEIAFFSLSENDREEVDEEKSAADKRIRKLLDDSERLLATILISNHFVNVTIVVLGAFFFSDVMRGEEAEGLRLAICVIVLTFLLLLFGEIMPRIYSAQDSLGFCRKVAPLIVFLRRIFRPFSDILVRSAFFVNRMAQKHKKTGLSVDELSQALELTDKREISEESNMLEGIIRFGEETAKEVMTSRLDMVDLEIGTPFSEVIRCVVDNAYSRIPVYEESRDNIKGILYIKDLLPYLEKTTLSSGRT